MAADISTLQTTATGILYTYVTIQESAMWMQSELVVTVRYITLYMAAASWYSANHLTVGVA